MSFWLLLSDATKNTQDTPQIKRKSSAVLKVALNHGDFYISIKQIVSKSSTGAIVFGEYLLC